MSTSFVHLVLWDRISHWDPRDSQEIPWSLPPQRWVYRCTFYVGPGFKLTSSWAEIPFSFFFYMYMTVYCRAFLHNRSQEWFIMHDSNFIPTIISLSSPVWPWQSPLNFLIVTFTTLDTSLLVQPSSTCVLWLASFTLHDFLIERKHQLPPSSLTLIVHCVSMRHRHLGYSHT